ENVRSGDEQVLRLLPGGLTTADAALLLALDGLLQRLIVGELPPRLLTQLVFRFQLFRGDQPLNVPGAVDREASPDIGVEVDFNAAQNNTSVERIVDCSRHVTAPAPRGPRLAAAKRRLDGIGRRSRRSLGFFPSFPWGSSALGFLQPLGISVVRGSSVQRRI